MMDMSKLKVVSRYELLKQFRRKRFYGALVITVLAVVLMIVLYQGLDIPTQMALPAELINQYGAEIFPLFVTSMSALATIAAVFFAGDSIASEFEHRTGHILFPNPVKRRTIVFGKYLASVIAMGVIILIAYLISSGALLYFYAEIPIGILGSLAIALALGCSVISLAFAFSSLLSGGMGATVATLLMYIVIFPIISTSLTYAGYSPWFLPDRAGDAMTATYDIPLEEFMGGFGPGQITGGLMEASSDPTRSFLVLVIYSIVLLIVSILVTERREVT